MAIQVIKNDGSKVSGQRTFDLRVAAGSYDVYWNNVVFLSHFDGVDGGTTFVDLKGHALTNNNSCTTSVTQSKFGGTSLKFGSGTGELVLPNTSDLLLGTSDFCVEFWWYNPGSAASSALFGKPTTAGINYAGIGIGVNGDGAKLDILMSSTGTSWDICYANTGANATNTSAWNHIALVRYGSVFTCYVNGGGTSVATNSAAIYAAAAGWCFGKFYGYNNQPGYIDEARITIGVPRYTADFTPSTQPFTAY